MVQKRRIRGAHYGILKEKPSNGPKFALLKQSLAFINKEVATAILVGILRLAIREFRLFFHGVMNQAVTSKPIHHTENLAIQPNCRVPVTVQEVLERNLIGFGRKQLRFQQDEP